MLTARNAPRACQSCRLQLLSLFEHGFTTPALTNTPRAKYSTRSRLHTRGFQSRPNILIKKLSTSAKRSEETKQDLPRDAEPIATQSTASSEEIESFVRQARQTFGETLPKDYLTTEEYILYERLYGPPLRETRPEDLEYLPGGEEEVAESQVRNVILKENAMGEYEEIEFDPELGFSITDDIDPKAINEALLEAEARNEGEPLEAILEEENQVSITEPEDTVQVQGQNQREIDAISRLQVEFDAATLKAAQEEPEPYKEDEEEEYVEEELLNEEDIEEDDPDWISSDAIRTHPHTMTGRGGTFPSTLNLPKEQFTAPITELLARTNMKHLSDAAERAFGGKGLPYSAATPSSKKLLPQKHIGLDASQHKMTEMEADAYMSSVMPGTYAAVMGTLVEIRKRLGSQWIRDLILREGGEGPRILDAGAGGVGVIAWRQILQAEWDVMKEEGLVEGAQVPFGKTTVLTGSAALRHRVSRFLEDTTFLPRLPDYVHASNSESHIDGSPAFGRKSYDIVIAPHTLFPLKEEFRRKNMVQNLWSLTDKAGGILLLVEKGLPRGFEAIAGARSLLLKSHIASPGDTAVEDQIQSPESGEQRFIEKEEGMIIAPCTNHTKCPMYPVPGLSTGRKDFCHFPQRFIRPDFLQKVLGASIRNHEDVKYSYIAVQRGVDLRKGSNAPLQGEEATLQSLSGYEDHDLPGSGEESDIKFSTFALPRIVLPSLKRRGHVTLDLCSPSGRLERWTVPKSFSKIAYRDARKSKWGDLWALGAKTRVFRAPRLGRLGEEGGKIKGIRDGKIGKGGKKMKKNHFDIIMGDEGMDSIQPSRKQSKFVDRGKRTKGGRIWKEPKPIGEDDL